MAKSLRSKKQQGNKIIKRQSVFGEAAAAREKRIAERLHNAALEDILAKQESSTQPTNPAESMEVETESVDKPATTESAPSTKPKKSTGGWSKQKKGRGGRRSSKKSRK